jgi:hypothetical protein
MIPTVFIMQLKTPRRREVAALGPETHLNKNRVSASTSVQWLRSTKDTGGLKDICSVDLATYRLHIDQHLDCDMHGDFLQT